MPKSNCARFPNFYFFISNSLVEAAENHLPGFRARHAETDRRPVVPFGEKETRAPAPAARLRPA